MEKTTPTPNLTPTEDSESFRGYISSKEATYYLLNELIGGQFTKVFSAVKIALGLNEKKLENEKLCVRFISKKWITLKLFGQMNIEEEKINKYFNSLKKKFESFRKITHINMQMLKDYIEEERGIFVVYEYCDCSLFDYLKIIREPYRKSWSPFEIRVRKLIAQLLEVVTFVHEKYSQLFGSALNTQDVMVLINDSNEGNIKITHPFMLDIFTLVKIIDADEFPHYYSPELFIKLFEMSEENKYDLNGLVSKIDHKSDYWSLGCLLYEIIWEITPFVFTSLKDAVSCLKKESTTYIVYPKRISKQLLACINKCLQVNPQFRITLEMLNVIKTEMNEENDKIEDLQTLMSTYVKNGTDFEFVDNFNLIDLRDI